MSETYAQLTCDWQNLLRRYSTDLREQVAQIAHEYRAELAATFYRYMLEDAQASPFLEHQQVHARLEPALQRWISSLLATADEQALAAQVEQQKKIGEIHARLDIPLTLVLRGARYLKSALAEVLARVLPTQQHNDAVNYAGNCVDIAMELMSHVYGESHSRNNRAEEAYRLFSVTQNISTERQRQRAALLDWENQLMFEVASAIRSEQLPRVLKSEFGLWFRHKAADSFQGAPQMQQIQALLERIDEHYLPAFGEPENALRLLRDVREASRSVQFLLESLFEQAGELDVGRDALTQLLNRKFLPVVLTKQVANARRNGSQFALLMVDIDHFKQINDNHGHDIGDQVLQHVAAVMGDSMRAGDYAFRHGGEEFLLLIVDTSASSARIFAERLRQNVANQPVKLPSGVSLSVTISIGIALHDGHPDYLRSVRAADTALYKAKELGRNRCELAPQ